MSYDLLLAGSAPATVPIILFIFLRRQFMAGASFTGTGVQQESGPQTCAACCRRSSTA